MTSDRDLLLEFLDGRPAGQLDHQKTDLLRERVPYSPARKEELAAARAQNSRDPLFEIEQGLGDLHEADAPVVVDLFLSYRAVKAWDDMVRVRDRMPPWMRETAMIQEQLAFALNRAGDGERAERILTALVERRGPSSETCALLGRVYKDRWIATRKSGAADAPEWLDKAIAAYLDGFEADPRDCYPGINAVTLMELKEPPDERRRNILTVLRQSIAKKIVASEPDYWDHATLVELAVLAEDEAAASDALADALAHMREPWEAETTALNLSLINAARKKRGAFRNWMLEIETALEKRASP